MTNLISAIVVGDSINEWGDRITTMEVVMPRIILAEFNTHRMFSRNSASSRAIPFKRMVEMVETNPFIPIAWQKEHSGMQGTEYITDGEDITYIRSEWLMARRLAVQQATQLTKIGVTKQLANRLLEPFMYHKVLVTSTEWENFFELRSPQYKTAYKDEFTRSKKELYKLDTYRGLNSVPIKRIQEVGETLAWLEVNKGAAEIHMMDLAEKMWDALNESKPKQLKSGEWHIPYESHIDEELLMDVILHTVSIEERKKDDLVSTKNNYRIKIATGMAARVSYTTVGDEKEVSYETLINIYEKMAKARPFHASPFEHCSQAMSKIERETFVRGILESHQIGNHTQFFVDEEGEGWCRNFKGFIQLRAILENEI